MPPLDDIPEATRDLPLGTVLSPDRDRGRLFRPSRRLILVIGVAAIALGSGGLTAWYQATGNSPFSLTQATEKTPGEVIPAAVTPPQPDNGPPPSTPTATNPTLLGHHAYDQAREADLVNLTSHPTIRLRPAAATAFETMIRAAARAGVRLVPLSGYRSYGDQEKVFFGLQTARHQTVQTRAEVSAPPGYSEHHTGYAVDIGDGAQPGTNLDENFLHTSAYEWMKTNAVSFGFELSFPADNPQGVAFEPWHWRFVGDRQSLETFYRK